MSDASKSFSVSSLIEAEAERLASALRQKLIPHPGELGAAREHIVREFIQQQLPKRFAVSTGFVLDVHGAISDQMDIIIHDAEDCPVFTTPGEAKFFPCEGVLAVGQVKSNITSADEYESALQNIRSAKRLDRSTRGQALSTRSGEPIEHTSNHLHQIFSFVFIINRCLQKDTMFRAQYEHLWHHPRHEWPNMTLAFDQYLLSHCCHDGLCPNPMHAFAVGLVDEANRADLLLWFVRLLTRAVVSTHPATFSYHAYLEGEKPRPWASFPFADAPVKQPKPKHLTSIPIPEWWRPNRPL
jgi:hypothetical protein